MTDTDKILFPSRFGIENKPLIDSNFPESARIALWFVLRRNVEFKRSEGWYRIAEELLRLHRVKKSYEDDEAPDLSYNILQAYSTVSSILRRISKLNRYDRKIKSRIGRIQDSISKGQK